MMATVPHVTSGSGLRQFQADGFLFDRVYMCTIYKENTIPFLKPNAVFSLKMEQI